MIRPSSLASPHAPAGPGVIRVASVPSGHVYVRHCADGRQPDGVVRLADPRPNGAPSNSQQWWPPVMLDPAWVRAHHTEFDLFHLHFGFDAQTPAQLAELVRTLKEFRKPLVYTVHDLRNPHQADPAPHDAALDVLIPAADHLFTLTPGAAGEIARRWNRHATVVPHPHVVEEPRLSAPRPEHEGFRVGLHAKSLRPNMALLPVLEVLTAAVGELPDAVLQVNLHREAADPGAHAHAPEVVAELRALAAAGRIVLREHDYFDDDQLWDYLSSLDLSVLPYAFGTHSGWLEACHDLGTAVAVPTCGYYAEQRACLRYGLSLADGLHAGSLRAAVREAYRTRPQWRADAADRAAERARVAEAHRAVYQELLA
ncbi:glycosyltransferase family 1 protein [Streptomyces sp. NPDC088745]|uniref:glycosyltransferase family 1 protein n=1 Tax=Streptomyces sp. NPDC088745 TaxID=3365884 RepID=UPI00382C3438